MDKNIEKKFDVVIELLQQMVAMELLKNGATHEQIGKQIHVAKATVGKMLQGVKKDK